MPSSPQRRHFFLSSRGFPCPRTQGRTPGAERIDLLFSRRRAYHDGCLTGVDIGITVCRLPELI